MEELRKKKTVSEKMSLLSSLDLLKLDGRGGTKEEEQRNNKQGRLVRFIGTRGGWGGVNGEEKLGLELERFDDLISIIIC